MEDYLGELDFSQNQPIRIEKFLALRGDEEVHTEFVQRFVKLIVGVSIFHNRIKDSRRSPDHLYTVTDEAFALLLLENSYDCWLDLFRKSGNRKPPTKRKRDSNDAAITISDVRPKYTEGGISYSYDTDSTSNRGRGWSEAGRICFNALVDLVIKSRSDHPNFLKNFVEKERQKMQDRKQRKQRHNRLENVVLPKHDKFCDEEVHTPHFNDSGSESESDDDDEASDNAASDDDDDDDA